MSQSEAATNVEAIRDEWLGRLNQLVDNVKTWAESLDWSTRRLDKPMKDMETRPLPGPRSDDAKGVHPHPSRPI